MKPTFNKMLVVFLLQLLIMISPPVSADDFSPDTSDYDAYGLKIAANNLVLVESQPASNEFLVLFAPYDNVTTGQQCSVAYDDNNDYVYSVGVGFQSNDSNFYAIGQFSTASGESTDSTGGNATFIAYYNATNDQQCGQISRAVIEHVPLSPQDFLVMAVHPTGQFALGLAVNFAFKFNPFGSSVLSTNASFWPNRSFAPRAADMDTNFTVVAGLVSNSASSRVRASVVVYLIDNSLSTVYSTWTYVAANNSWQSRLTFAGADSWSVKYTMSVDINNFDPTRVLVGIPYLNTVFHFTVSGGGRTLTLSDQRSNGNSVGFGKGVAWLASNQAAILANQYTSTFSSWLSSQIWLYTQLPTTGLASAATAIIPNCQQPIPPDINSELLNIKSTPSALAVLDVSGGILFIIATAPGYYASTNTNLAPVSIAIPVISTAQSCCAGMMKSDTGIHPCSLCPMGWKSSAGSINCTVCNASAFCPLGAVDEVSQSELQTVSQAYAYPQNPEQTTIEDILVSNVFQIGSGSNCVVVSPLFWALIVLIPMVIIFIIIMVYQISGGKVKGSRHAKTIRKLCKQTDFIGEGEIWLGGLISIVIMVLLIQAYVFSSKFVNQYPAEKVGDSNFACDVTLRNALFQSMLQSLAVPLSDEEQTMFDLLDNQEWTLNVNFINTAINCSSISVYQIFGTSSIAVAIASCTIVNSIVKTSIILSSDTTSMQLIINDINPIGAISVGVTATGNETGSYTLRELGFSQAFYSNSQTLAQTVLISLSVSKVVNKTEPLSGSEAEFAGNWYPVYTVDKSTAFVTSDTYVTSSNLTQTTVSIDITETSYYIRNVQTPLVKIPNMVFQNLLFTILLLEMFGLGFLVFKLLLIPLLTLLLLRNKHWRNRLCGNDEDNSDDDDDIESQRRKLSGRKTAKVFPDSTHSKQSEEPKQLHVSSSSEQPNDSQNNPPT